MLWGSWTPPCGALVVATDLGGLASAVEQELHPTELPGPTLSPGLTHLPLESP